MPRLQGLIFDCDGTLLDSAPVIAQALNKMLQQQGRRLLSLEEVKPMIGEGAMALVERGFLATGGPPGSDLFPFVQQYISAYRNITSDPAQIFPHVLDVLERYSKAGVKLGICTNKQELLTHRVLEELNLQGFFGFVAGGDTFPVHKPHPDHVYGVIKALDVPREGCVFVGDGPADVRAAHGAQIPCIVVTHGYTNDAEDLDADRLINGFDELPAALQEMGFTL
jgi:phosphoglycolate phosphatase